MSKFKFMSLSLVLLGLGMLFVSNVVSADQVTENQSKVALSIPLNEIKTGEAVSKEVVMPDGQKANITVTKESGGTAFRSVTLGSEKVSNGTYKVHVVWGVVNAGFSVDIDTRNITRAYGLWYYNFASTSAKLIRASNKRAYAEFQLEHALPLFGGPSYNLTLEAVMDADHLVTYFG